MMRLTTILSAVCVTTAGGIVVAANHSALTGDDLRQDTQTYVNGEVTDAGDGHPGVIVTDKPALSRGRLAYLFGSNAATRSTEIEAARRWKEIRSLGNGGSLRHSHSPAGPRRRTATTPPRRPKAKPGPRADSRRAAARTIFERSRRYQERRSFFESRPQGTIGNRPFKRGRQFYEPAEHRLWGVQGRRSHFERSRFQNGRRSDYRTKSNRRLPSFRDRRY